MSSAGCGIENGNEMGFGGSQKLNEMGCTTISYPYGQVERHTVVHLVETTH